MDDNQILLKEILDNPTKFYTNNQLKYLSLKINKELGKGGMNKFVKKMIEYDKDREFIFTDGSCINNGKKNSYGGYGIFFGRHDLRNVSQRYDRKLKITNNIAELTAINECLKVMTPEVKYYIVSDSEYSINCITKWYKGWQINGWKTAKGKPVLNKELIQDILKHMKILNVKYLHVESHKTKPNDKKSMEYRLWYGNEMADRLANPKK